MRPYCPVCLKKHGPICPELTGTVIILLAIPETMVILGFVVATPVYACLMLFIGTLLGCLVAVPAILFGSRTMQTKIPFGPFLIVATVIVYLFGREISEAYLRLLGIS